jgi:hypothetical protein
VQIAVVDAKTIEIKFNETIKLARGWCIHPSQILLMLMIFWFYLVAKNVYAATPKNDQFLSYSSYGSTR